MANRNLSIIATEIIADMKIQNPANWKQKYACALAYIQPMQMLNSINDNYGFDSGKSIVAYGLGNMQIWKGEVARKIKKELNGMLK